MIYSLHVPVFVQNLATNVYADFVLYVPAMMRKDILQVPRGIGGLLEEGIIYLRTSNMRLHYMVHTPSVRGDRMGLSGV